MELKAGYKQTEVGVVPVDWLIQTIKNIASVVRGGSPRPAGDPRYFDGSFIPWLTVASLTNISAEQLVVLETATCLTEAGSQQSRTLTPGTLIVANSGATLGVAKILGIKCCANDGVVALQSLDRGVSAEYVAYYINTQTKYLREVVATGNGQPNLNTGLVGEITFPVPPTLAEQQAIADALIDADALIESLGQLLSKKRQIKQGSMQELLTGVRRLPGFSGEWVEEVFGELAGVRSERIDPRRVSKYEFCVELEHIGSATGHLLGHGETSEQSALKSVFYSGDVLFGKLRAYLRKYWLAEKGGVCSTEIWCLHPKGLLKSNQLLFQLIQMNSFIEVASMAYGTHMPRSDWKSVKELVVKLPSDEMEQLAIAEALSTIDSEIASIESRLQKARQLKQGMTQELLTGRIRLV